MPIPVNIEQLLSATSIEGARIEYKKGWNPDAIYRSICAFANDFDNSGGGYIIIGVQEQNGRPMRPVKGLELNEIEPIEKDMIGFNNLIQPAYYPHTSLEDVDGKKVLVIWIPGGTNRPYKVPDEVTSKHKRYNYYIRYNSSSIIAKGEFEKELLELTNQIPFDDRANMQASLKDISRTLVRDFLIKTGSRLADSIEESRFSDILQQMDIVAGRFFNYPYQALEEAVVNSLYHRDYQMREPVEITIEPDCIRIISYGGPDRSIKLDDLNRGVAHARRYRNRKLGDFLKELDLTEGKATGIPTIIKEMKANGSPAASFETDDARTYFIVTFPIHPVFVQNEPQNEPQNTVSVTLRQDEILRLIKADGRITRAQMSGQLKISEATIKREIKYLREHGILRYDGPTKSGKWIVNTDIDIVVHL